MDTALVRVLGAVAYGELKAYEGAKAEAEAATDPAQRRRHRKVAAEELRHHKGFVARLEAMGADPTRAMRPFHGPLDRYHGRLTGLDDGKPQQAAWMKSMRGERERRRRRSVLDSVMLFSVAVAVVLAAIWFFGFAGSSLPGA